MPVQLGNLNSWGRGGTLGERGPGPLGYSVGRFGLGTHPVGDNDVDPCTRTMHMTHETVRRITPMRSTYRPNERPLLLCGKKPFKEAINSHRLQRAKRLAVVALPKSMRRGRDKGSREFDKPIYTHEEKQRLLSGLHSSSPALSSTTSTTCTLNNDMVNEGCSLHALVPKSTTCISKIEQRKFQRAIKGTSRPRSPAEMAEEKSRGKRKTLVLAVLQPWE